MAKSGNKGKKKQLASSSRSKASKSEIKNKKKSFNNNNIPKDVNVQSRGSLDYISSLVRMVGDNDKFIDAANKSKRIEKRKAKKMERELKIQHKKHQNRRKNHETKLSNTSQNKVKPPGYSMERLQTIAEMLAEAMEKHVQTRSFLSDKGKDSSLLSELINKRFQRFKMNIDSMQPRKGSYGGIGFARDSYYLSLDDPSFIPKLEEEFAEHIDGFFGKQRTKAMKKQLDKDMLWRRLLKEKGCHTQGDDYSKTATTVFAASDLKVHALIDQGTSLM